MNRFPVDEVRKLPYVDQMPTDGRPILLRPFYDHERKVWISYVPVGDGKLGRLAGGEVIVGSYFARAPADVLVDLEFPAGTLIAQCASFTGVIGALASLENDFFDLACILRKYELIATQSRADSMSASLLLSSELAYLIITVRSLYDILQKLSKNCVFRGMSITRSDAMSITHSDAMSITDSDVMPITFWRSRNG